MVKNRQNSQLSPDISNDRPIIAKHRGTSAKIFVKKSVDMGLILEKNMGAGCFFSCPIHTPRHSFGQVPTTGWALYC